MSNRAIAARLYVTERTVEAHVTQNFHKLHLPESPDQHRRVLAVLAFLRARPGRRVPVFQRPEKNRAYIATRAADGHGHRDGPRPEPERLTREALSIRHPPIQCNP
jgi:hypothetical protein